MIETMSKFSRSIFERTYSSYPGESWNECSVRVAKAIAMNYQQENIFTDMISKRSFLPAGRYLATSGRSIQQVSNCFAFIPEDSREGWADLLRDVTMCLSMGGGVGVMYANIRPSGSRIGRMGGVASGPIALMQVVNEVGRHVMSGGFRRSAIWAGLPWDHADVETFIKIKDWHPDIRSIKEKNFENPAPLDMSNVSVLIDSAYLSKLEFNDPSVTKLHTTICDYMLRTGEPAFRNQSRILKDDPTGFGGNPCQESTLGHRSVCNLGSIVLPRVRDLGHLEELTRAATRFLINGSIRGSYPTPEIAATAKKERRIGLGIMGLHEWMILHGHKYEWSDELARWLSLWANVCREEANIYADHLGVERPIVTRAIAPTGTISIIAETTSGIEPIFCRSYKRRYINGDKHYYQYVVDPTVKRLIDLGMSSKSIEDAYDLSLDVERRIKVQAYITDYLDQAVSSTINLPEYGSSGSISTEEFAGLMRIYLPRLKGITTYPNNSRPGQPLSPVNIDEAMSNVGVVYEETGDSCKTGVCGI